MRKIDVSRIRSAVSGLCEKANFELRADILRALKRALANETDRRARSILRDIIENAELARSKKLAICQDTGMVCVRLEIGQSVQLTGGSLRRAVDDGVREAYRRCRLRKSVVIDPFMRKNTGTNEPAILVTEIVAGDRVRVEVSPKGFGSENKSRIMMFRPTARIEEIKRFILETALNAGPDACPPLVLGVGIGGTFETAAQLAKKALLRPIGARHPERHVAKLEKELLKELNALGIGPMGLGGRTSVLGVNILTHPVHIAGLPVAVNVSCHATRSAARTI
jgi:fumarate hydratase subunit alpha